MLASFQDALPATMDLWQIPRAVRTPAHVNRCLISLFATSFQAKRLRHPQPPRRRDAAA
jgi:hypothetical protein